MKTRIFDHYCPARGVALLTLCAGLLGGCEPISMTVMSIGANAGLSHALGGIVYRTFSAPTGKVQTASEQALAHMGIKIVGREKTADGETVILAQARDRDIRILLEPITSRTTRVRATASSGLLMDGATATEIVEQTDRALNDTQAVALKRKT